ncbi:hypothetical protein B0F90DRAFT_254368 [Multifurca ochricompacta]|uniref:Uncharacterized protein n=1 Tax=Multifurca ochricompacta TaxID=376703 RepID=A0AAD4M4N7_9AGAM|nr:hypothetical protein B0F90DRAFT_254368 [Multifurca ochricompacta]
MNKPPRKVHGQVRKLRSSTNVRSTIHLRHKSHSARPSYTATPYTRAQRYPLHGSSFHNSGSEQYAQAPTDDHSWYRVERPNYHHSSHDHDYYSEDGDRHSDVSGAGIHLISESSRVDSPIPTVHRQGTSALGSRLYEQFPVSPPVPAHGPPTSVTRIDLHEDVSENYEGFDRLHRATSAHSNTLYPASPSHQPSVPGLQRHSHRRLQQHAFQSPVHLTPGSDSSRSDVVQTLDNGSRITVRQFMHSNSNGISRTAS